MKTSIWHLTFVLLACLGLASTLSTHAYGQQPPTGQSGSGVGGTAVCGNPPCGPGLSTGIKRPMPPPLTPEQQQALNEQFRYEDLFSTLTFYERQAQKEDAAGNADMAAGWRSYFAKKSGMTTDEANTVKKIAEEYLKEREVRYKNYRDAISTARSLPHTVRPSRLNTPAIAEAQDALEGLFPSVKAKLVSALGSRSYTRLDGYTIHMHDNAKILYRQGQPANGQPQIPPTTTETKETPQ